MNSILIHAFIDELEKTAALKKEALDPVFIPAGLGAYFGAKKGKKTDKVGSGMARGAAGAVGGTMAGELGALSALMSLDRLLGRSWHRVISPGTIPIMAAGGLLGGVAGYKALTKNIGKKKGAKRGQALRSKGRGDDLARFDLMDDSELARAVSDPRVYDAAMKRMPKTAARNIPVKNAKGPRPHKGAPAQTTKTNTAIAKAAPIVEGNTKKLVQKNIREVQKQQSQPRWA